MMGGSIGVESQPGCGSTFWFEVDLALGRDVEPARDSVRQNGAAERPTASKRILLAEDNLINQKVATKLLSDLGCQVDIAATGSAAIAMAEERQYDLILMDCQMPEVDGYTATMTIRASQCDSPRVPVIALTASALPEDRRRCMEAGMDDYLSKPIGREDLREVLDRWLVSA